MNPEYQHIESDRCERCGRSESHGEHGVGLCPFQPRKAHAVAPDDVPGGFFAENGFSTPQKFYSKSEHIKALEANGNMLAPRWVPNDKVLTNWAAACDPKTMDNARVLLSRKSKASKDDVPAAPPALIRELKDRLYR